MYRNDCNEVQKDDEVYKAVLVTYGTSAKVPGLGKEALTVNRFLNWNGLPAGLFVRLNTVVNLICPEL